MKNHEIIKAVAELDGLREEYIEGNGIDGNLWFNSKDVSCELPHYLTSRDAIVPVIEKQNMTIKDAISGYLYRLQSSGEHQFLATPPQLCEALLRATEKWVE